jgi:hypothetical protein
MIQDTETSKAPQGADSSPSPCSALAGTFDIEAIEQAFFNHDHDGAEPAPGQWEKRRDAWRSFKAYLAAHPRQEVAPERTDGGCTPIVPDDSPCLPNV